MFVPIYRGKKIDGGWITGCLAFDPDKGDILGIIPREGAAHPLDIPYMDEGCIDGNFPTVQPETAGAYTGVDDAGGVQIFEDDILTVRLVLGPYQGFDFGRLRVEFRKGSFMLVDHLQRDFVALSGLNHNIKLKVIGNIHDNPELMGGSACP